MKGRTDRRGEIGALSSAVDGGVYDVLRSCQPEISGVSGYHTPCACAFTTLWVMAYSIPLPLVLSSLILVLFLTACQQNALRKAEMAGTVEGWEEFLEAYPDYEGADRVHETIETIRFRTAKELNEAADAASKRLKRSMSSRALQVRGWWWCVCGCGVVVGVCGVCMGVCRPPCVINCPS